MLKLRKKKKEERNSLEGEKYWLWKPQKKTRIKKKATKNIIAAVFLSELHNTSHTKTTA